MKLLIYFRYVSSALFVYFRHVLDTLLIMKKAALYNLLTIGIAFLTMSQGCDDSAADMDVYSNGEYIQVPIGLTECDSLIEMRRTMDTYRNEQGELQLLEVGFDEWQMVLAPERMSKYMYSGVVQVCNLPDTLASSQFDGRKVIFSGILKEIYPTENMPGGFFRLTSIQVSTQQGPAN